MTEHYTPGPWKAEIESVFGNDGKLVAEAYTWSLENGTANARLIAEAPAMLELIKRGMAMDANPNYGECPCNLCKAGRAIIARIEGQE